MAGFGSSLALAIWLTSGLFDNIERISPEMAIERAKQCGLGPATVRYEDELQSDILTVANATGASDRKLACLDKATGWGIFVELPSDVQRRFDAIKEARASAMMLGEAREWLLARGLLSKVPIYVPGRTDEAAFTGEVEQLCGPRAKGAFQSKYGFHALSPDWMTSLGMPLKPEDQEAFGCLTNVMAVAGFKVGFIGNEAHHTSK